MVPRRTCRNGVTLVEVLVLVLIIVAIGMVVVMAIPKSREGARLNSCNRNLSEIGKALAQFDTASGHLPSLPKRGEIGDGPLATLARQFGLERFEDAQQQARPAPFQIRRVRGFVCPADLNLIRVDPFPPQVSYRANAGPGTDGTGGPFTFGNSTSIADAEGGAGQDYIAAFSERLLGSGSGTKSRESDYLMVPGPVGTEPCPAEGDWRGDAGASWAVADWQSTIYNHSMRPNESPSCIAQDGATARMGASSAHLNRVNSLMLGGSVRGFTPRVDRVVWRTVGTLAGEKTAPAKP